MHGNLVVFNDVKQKKNNIFRQTNVFIRKVIKELISRKFSNHLRYRVL